MQHVVYDKLLLLQVMQLTWTGQVQHIASVASSPTPLLAAALTDSLLLLLLLLLLQVMQLTWTGQVQHMASVASSPTPLLAAALTDSLLLLRQNPTTGEHEVASRAVGVLQPLVLGWTSLASCGLLPRGLNTARAALQVRHCCKLYPAQLLIRVSRINASSHAPGGTQDRYPKVCAAVHAVRAAQWVCCSRWCWGGPAWLAAGCCLGDSTQHGQRCRCGTVVHNILLSYWFKNAPSHAPGATQDLASQECVMLCMLSCHVADGRGASCGLLPKGLNTARAALQVQHCVLLNEYLNELHMS
jgi:hypothetical protein